MKIEPDYSINKSTIAIIPAKQIEFDSIVIEESQKFYIRQTPLQIIKASCLEYWSDYEGRRKAVIHHTGFKEKVPIPINSQEVMVAFPTHAIKHFDCSWLFYNHILQHERVKDDPTKTLITFTNGQTLSLNVSAKSIKTQLTRSLEIIQRIRSQNFKLK